MFMQPQVTERQTWHHIDGTEGSVYIPTDLFSLEDAKDLCYVGEVWETETVTGYGARLSAPGYMDCTEWTVHETVREAVRELARDNEDPKFIRALADILRDARKAGVR